MKKEIYLAGGCFWGTQYYLQQITGILHTEVGYANGNTSEPTYQKIIAGNTGFTEAVKVIYDPSQIDLPFLLQLFFKSIDPTSLNRQGNDIGDNYRTGVYYVDPKELPLIQFELKQLAQNYKQPIVVEALPLKNFYKAEDYHQDYLIKNPRGYCHIPKALFEYAQKANAPYQRPSQQELKQKLSPLQYQVTQEAATERPFANEYYNEFREGIYVDITTGEPLFVSTDKFESGCGWPSFSKPIDNSLIEENKDTSLGLLRIEVKSKRGQAHLGHVFEDGPKDKGGLRYCINSAALRFVPKAKMEQEGYGRYLRLLEGK